MRGRLRFRTFWPLWLGIALMLLMGVLSFTPLAWRLMGSPSESYPELVFIGVGLPVALVVVVIGVLHVTNVLERRKSEQMDDQLHR